MSGPVVLLALLSLFHVAISLTPCDYQTDLIGPYLTDENLYCFDDEGVDHEVNEFSRLCSSGTFTPRTDGMDVRCGDGFTLVGYSFYSCDTETGELATDLGSDDTLTQYSACVADADAANICAGVNVASAVNKLKVESDAVENIDLVPVDSTEYVSYAMACDDGFGFMDDVSIPVYGYCSGNTDGNNEFTLDGTDGCYEMCSPDNTNLEGVTLNREDGSRAGAIVSAEVVCPSGFETAFGAAEEYEFTCNGEKEGEADGGIYVCDEEACPQCLAQCPANPTADQITNFGDVEFLASVVITEPAASGQTVLAEVTCADGYSLEVGAERTYDFQCNSNENDTEASSGLWTLVNDFPVCHPGCPAETVSVMDFVEMVIISSVSSGVEGQTVEGIVTCDSGYALEAGVDVTFDFICTGGTFVPVGDGPQCQKECTVPDSNGTFIFYHEDEEMEVGRAVKPGKHHIELRCSNDTLKLVGPPTMSCSGDGELTHDDEMLPFCSDTQICPAPKVENADLNTRNNLEVGGVFDISCRTSHYFDTKTVKEFNAGDLSKEKYTKLSVTCDGEAIRDFKCHFGCLAPDFAGKTFPDMAEQDQAPYEIGAVVQFQCLDGESIEGDAEATCDIGGIPSPVCGACSFALSLFLTIALFLTLL